MKFSPELNFIPAKAPYEITNLIDGNKLIPKITKEFIMCFKNGVWIHPKLDPLRNPHSPEATYSVEIVPIKNFETEWLNKNDASFEIFKTEINHIFNVMKKKFDMVPSVMKMKKGEEIHYPGGGCHLHMGADHFPKGMFWYDNMKRFHSNFIMEYANRPYIRWLFSNWFADAGSRVLINSEAFKHNPKYVMKNSLAADYFMNCNGIEPRFMNSSKGNYLTFELRFFSMVENYDELVLITKFAEQWINRLVVLTHMNKKLKFDLTPDKLKNLEKVKYAREACKEFVTLLGLKWDDYEIFFERNYKRRIENGVFV